MWPATTRTGSLSGSSPLKAAAAAALLTLAACASPPPSPPPTVSGEPPGVAAPAPAPQTPRRTLTPARFDALPGWAAHDPRPALSAFVESCRRLDARPPDAWMNPRAPYAGRVGDWRGVCLEAAVIHGTNPQSADVKAFFERRFTPVRLGATGRLTGYYEPLIEVRARPDAVFSMPLRARPDDLLTGDLGQFIAGLEGRRIVGRAAERTFEPYRTRAEIEARDIGVPLAWGRPIEVFFLQIQGSGRLVYPDGGQARVRFAAHNGRPYVSIGRVLIDRGELSPHGASKQHIEAWLAARGPQAWEALFNENPRYVFFTLEPLRDAHLGPTGAHGAPLTAMASLAVDPAHHAWGVPVFLSADLPDAPGWSGLVVAQDAGGAITGPARGDLFFGGGDAAGARAGRQNDPNARWTLLLPEALAAQAPRR